MALPRKVNVFVFICNNNGLLEGVKMNSEIQKILASSFSLKLKAVSLPKYFEVDFWTLESIDGEEKSNSPPLQNARTNKT